ncbi:restriction endonuclease subunit S [Kovacikia minuta CCNUW1]|uniref:restriction endonuclease subunit S n=1 Tax=Kovacikia minuta TaxID=2931930 RepID=UPI001CCB9FF9|nr:restriction endonuclease subunit S [Kovacikia minuta]UBF28714.1 restriction endonuclease subunit S [Kovacikia minuta CCNUW1]
MSKLPKGWIIVRVEDVITLNPRNDCDDSTEVGFVPLQLLGVRFRDHHAFEQRLWAEVKRGYTHFANGDVLLARITPSFENGKAGIARGLPNGLGAGSTEYFVCRPLTGVVIPEYLLAHFKTTRFLIDGEHVMSGASGHKRVPKQYLLNSEFPLAPFNEQKRIVKKLDELLVRLDACRERLDRASRIIKRFRQAVLDAATSGQLTEDWRTEQQALDSDDGIEEELTEFNFRDAACFDSFRFPTSWNISRLGEIAEIAGGITKDSKKQVPTDEELPYLRVANVQRGFLDLSEIKTIRVPQNRVEELLLNRGDILFNEGGDIDKLGRGWVWNGEIERCTFQNHVFRVRLYNKLFEPKFFSWYGNSRGANYFLSVGKQTTNLASINKSLLSALPVVIPPAAEQQEIVRQVELLFAYADRLETHYQDVYAQVEQLVPTLLSKAFRGELVLQNSNDEPASILLERSRAEKALLEAERKTIRAVRPPKQAPKNVMKQLSEYSEALRSAFIATGREANARQLFDQAEFSPEEVVQFYEALRITPEVRTAFERAVEEKPQQ